jgi:ATP-dependent DNA ligase
VSGPFDALSDEEHDALEERDHPDWLDPMLATLTHDHFSDPDWIYEWTSSGCLRHPRFLGLRRDKDAEDVVREDRS